MTPFQQQWQALAGRFGLSVEIPFTLELDGMQFEFPVLLRQFGGPNGMLLGADFDEITPISDRLVAGGFGLSCQTGSEPAEHVDEDGFLEMLRDWGWCGDEDPPHWMTRTVSADDDGIHFLGGTRGDVVVPWDQIREVSALHVAPPDGAAFTELGFYHYIDAPHRLDSFDKGYEQVTAEMEKHLAGFTRAALDALRCTEEDEPIPVVWERGRAK